MLSNQATPSLVHHYKQFPLNDEPFNKKVQKHIPQRIDVVGNSAEFTIKTGLLELLPDECMVGVECCFMRDSVSSVSSPIYELGPIYSDYIWKVDFVTSRGHSYKYTPFVSINTVNDVIQVHNVPPINYNSDITTVAIQSKSYMPTSNIAPAFDVVTYTWQFLGWSANTMEVLPRGNDNFPLIAFYLTDQDITQVTVANPYNCYCSVGVYNNPDFYQTFTINSATYLPDSSQSLIIQSANPVSSFYVGSLVQFTLNGKLFTFPIKEIISDYIFKVILDRQYVTAYGVNVTGLPLTGISGAFVPNQLTIGGLGPIDVNILQIYPGSVIKLYQLPDNTCTWEVNDNVTFASPQTAPQNKSYQMTYFSGTGGDVRQYFQPTLVVPGILSTIIPSITNINIESPLFTSARTYNTSTNSYSQTIGSFPINSNNTVAFKEAVNNRNCSMYQINKNILNNFEIPFRITVDDGSALYQVQDPAAFYIRFSLWFYEQTDDERYYYIPTM